MNRNHWFPFVQAFLVIVLLPVAVPPAQAQSVGRVEQTTSDAQAYYRYVQVGAPTVLVQVLGAVQAPGMYELSQGTDLGQLLALSGGPTMGPRFKSNPRSVTVRLFRPEAGNERPLFEADLEQALTRSSAYPELQDGDVMTIEVIDRQRIGWRDLIALANTAAIFILAIDRLGN